MNPSKDNSENIQKFGLFYSAFRTASGSRKYNLKREDYLKAMRVLSSSRVDYLTELENGSITLSDYRAYLSLLNSALEGVRDKYEENYFKLRR